MKVAALTFVYNETINLPIWVKYYGGLFGSKNLFIVDRMSDDGSTEHLGDVNVIRIPRNPFDEDEKTNIITSFHTGLTKTYDCVIATDCDEILLPDPIYYDNLLQYIEDMKEDYVNALGIDVIHMLDSEMPINLTRPILSQRSIGKLHSPECKPLISKIPIKWLPGLHSSNRPPLLDEKLFIFHLKSIDYGHSMARQSINQSTVWSETSLAYNYGAHHRYTQEQFVFQTFLVPIDLRNRDLIGEFDFSAEITDIMNRVVVDQEGFYRIPMDVSKMVRIPERFREKI